MLLASTHTHSQKKSKMRLDSDLPVKSLLEWSQYDSPKCFLAEMSVENMHICMHVRRNHTQQDQMQTNLLMQGCSCIIIMLGYTPVLVSNLRGRPEKVAKRLRSCRMIKGIGKQKNPHMQKRISTTKLRLFLLKFLWITIYFLYFVLVKSIKRKYSKLANQSRCCNWVQVWGHDQNYCQLKSRDWSTTLGQRCVFLDRLLSGSLRLLAVDRWNPSQRGCCTKTLLVICLVTSRLLQSPVVLYEE